MLIDLDREEIWHVMRIIGKDLDKRERIDPLRRAWSKMAIVTEANLRTEANAEQNSNTNTWLRGAS